MTDLNKYDAPEGFDPRKFAAWFERVRKGGVFFEPVLLEAMDSWEEKRHFELSGQFTLSGNPEIYGPTENAGGQSCK